MTRIERNIIIGKPIEEVFKYTSDWKKWSEWFEGVSDFKPTTEIQKGNGARYAYDAKMMGLRVKVETEINNYVENKGWNGKSTKGMPHQTEWIFKSIEEGTEFIYALEYTLPIPILGILLDKWLMIPQWTKIIEKSLQNLKQKFK